MSHMTILHSMPSFTLKRAVLQSSSSPWRKPTGQVDHLLSQLLVIITVDCSSLSLVCECSMHWTGLRGNDMQTRPKNRIETTLEKTTTIGNHDEDRDKGKRLTIELSEQLEGLRVVAELDGTGRIGCKTDPHTAIISCALKTLHPQNAIRQRRKPWYSLFSYKKG